MISYNDDLVIIDFGHADKFDANGFIQMNDEVQVGNLLHLSPEVLQAIGAQKFTL